MIFRILDERDDTIEKGYEIFQGKLLKKESLEVEEPKRDMRSSRHICKRCQKDVKK